ncbi:hypothetical protein ASF38_03570 [Aeromicrobium sp. Leaf272]|nr:hypothetical protein ASF38_03570 [Aeromicrobium sp. Leaf272]
MAGPPCSAVAVSGRVTGRMEPVAVRVTSSVSHPGVRFRSHGSTTTVRGSGSSAWPSGTADCVISTRAPGGAV